MHKTNILGVLPEPESLRRTESLIEIYTRQMREASELLRALKRAPLQLVADDVGTGKTWVAMMVIFSCLNEALGAAKRSNSAATVKPQRAIVIAPTRSVQSKWVKELRRFTRQCLLDPSGVGVNLISSRKEFLELYANDTRGADRPCSCFDKVLAEPAPLQRLLGSPDGRRAFVVYLHDECIEQGWGGERKLVEEWKKTVKAYPYPAYRAAFRAVLPQGDVLTLASELLAYGLARGRSIWMDYPYDAGAVTSDNARRGWFSTRLWDLNSFVFAENVPEDLAQERIDRIVCTVSALWRAHERRSKKQGHTDRRPSCESGTVSDFYSRLSAWLESEPGKRDEWTKIVPGLLARILRVGLGPDRFSKFKCALKIASDGDSIVRFEEAERELASNIPIEMHQAVCLTNDLGAFSRRVDALVSASDGQRKETIVLGHSKLILYSPSGVFEDLKDLRREAKDVADATFEECLAKLVAPVYTANASCKVLEYVARILCELAAFEKAPDRVGSVFWYEVRKTRIVDVVYMRDLKGPAPLQRLLGSPDGRRAFVVYLHDECIEQGWGGERKLVEEWKKTVKAYPYPAYRAAFRAVLPQGEVLSLASELLAYGLARGRSIWMDYPYDAGAVTSDNARRDCFSTLLWDLNSFVFAENVPEDLAQERIDRIVCSVSALWRAHERRSKKQGHTDRRPSCESGTVSDFYSRLSAWLESEPEKRDEWTKIVPGLLARILRVGLGPDRFSKFKCALKIASDGDSIVRFEEAERELASNIPIEMNQAVCLTNDLGAFSRRVDALVSASDGQRKETIVLGHSKLNLYSPSGVFEDLEDLRREAKDVADATFEECLAKFVAPVYTANASCKMLEYVARILCELAAFEKAPDRVGSVFWFEPDEVPQMLGESISIAVVDEAHNWHLGNNGAKGFHTLLRGRAERVLLLTATPLQISETELKRIFDTVLPDRFLDETDSDFARAYKALFDNEGVTVSLRTVRKKSREFAQKLRTLAENDEAKEALERAAAHVSDDATSTEKSRIWSALEGGKEASGLHSDVLSAGKYSAVRELAEAARSYKEAQEAILKQLRCIVVKTRSSKFLDNERTIPSRRWYVGVETDLSNAVETALRPNDLHAALGLVPNDEILWNAYLWTNLIGMRLTTLDGEVGTRTRPRLLLGLPSSYEAYKESAQARGLIKGREEDEATDRAFYTSLIDDMLDVASDTHPKIKRTVDIVINAWQRGEKTLVFAERRETIVALEKCIKERLKRELQGIECLVEEELKTKTLQSPLDKQSVIEATLDAAQRFYGIKFGASGHKSISAWRCALLGANRVPPSQEDYDARATLIVMAALSVAARTSSRRIKEAINDLLKALRRESRLDPNQEGMEVNLYDAVRTVTGDTKNRNVLLETFNSPFPPLTLVCSTVGQEGVDMHRFCRTLVLHDLSWNPAKIEQRVGRLDRVASLSRVRREPVEIYVPYLAEGYDSWKFRRVLRRAEMQEALFGINEGVPDDELDDTKCLKENQDAELERQTPEWPALGNLMRGFFEMDVSVRSRAKEDDLNTVTRPTT